MADLTTNLTEDPVARPSRRNVLVGTAWAVPVVLGVGAAPAMAASLAWTIALPTSSIDLAYYNAHTNFTVTGTGVSGQVVTLSVTGISPNPTANVDANGNWTIAIPTASLPEGTITFQPTSGSAAFTPTTRSATKDTRGRLMPCPPRTSTSPSPTPTPHSPCRARGVEVRPSTWLSRG